eukprot:7887610-Lingulodinium_polyedra.AAC.1
MQLDVPGQECAQLSSLILSERRSPSRVVKVAVVMLIIGLVLQVVFALSCQGLLQVRAIVRQLVRGQPTILSEGMR